MMARLRDGILRARRERATTVPTRYGAWTLDIGVRAAPYRYVKPYVSKEILAHSPGLG